MIEKLKTLPIANEDAIVDRFGAPLNVGNYVVFPASNNVHIGRIIGYNWLYFQIGMVEPMVDHSTGQPVRTKAAHEVHTEFGFTGNSLINVDRQIVQSIRDVEDPLFAPLLDFSTSETKKVSRKYLVCLLAETNQPSTDPWANFQVCVASIAGSTTAEMDMFRDHLRTVYDKRILAFLLGKDSNRRAGGYSYPGTKRNNGSHHWNIGTYMYSHHTEPQMETYYVTQSDTQLSKRRIQEIGLMDYMDTIMSVSDYNSLDIENASKLELMI